MKFLLLSSSFALPWSSGLGQGKKYIEINAQDGQQARSITLNFSPEGTLVMTDDLGKEEEFKDPILGPEETFDPVFLGLKYRYVTVVEAGHNFLKKVVRSYGRIIGMPFDLPRQVQEIRISQEGNQSVQLDIKTRKALSLKTKIETSLFSAK